MGLQLITPPSILPVSLDALKQHLRVSHSDDDALLAIYLKAATEHAEWFTGRAFIDQVWELTLDGFPDAEIKVPKSPLHEVQSVKYGAGDTLLAADSYTVDNKSAPGRLVAVSSWPTLADGVNTVRIRFRAGYIEDEDSPSSNDVPGQIKSAILLLVGNLYAHRETIVIGQSAIELPWAAEQLLRPLRVLTGMA